MGKNNKIGAYITLDGAKTFQADVTSCNKELRSLQSELKLVEAQNAGNANSVESLSAKQEVLVGIFDKQQEKLQKSQEGLKHLENEYESIGKVLQEHRDKLSDARQTLEKMTETENISEEAIEKHRLEVEKEEDAIAILEEAYRKAAELNDSSKMVYRSTKT